MARINRARLVGDLMALGIIAATAAILTGVVVTQFHHTLDQYIPDALRVVETTYQPHSPAGS